MSFASSVTPPEIIPDDAWWFLFKSTKLLVNLHGGNPAVYRGPLPENAGSRLTNRNYIGTLDGVHCFCAEPDEAEPVFPGCEYAGLRGLYGVLPDDMLAAAGTALQVLGWDRTHKFCGACGSPLEPIPGERGRLCGACKLTFYPRITPAVITAVIRNGKILLAHNSKFQNGLYSLVAGFVEAGENLEDCVRREVREEVGIEISKVVYYGSQPWPFPNSLMIGFFAEYSSGEIAPDGVEITDARWFTPDTFPELPMHGSISRKIIDEYVRRYG